MSITICAFLAAVQGSMLRDNLGIALVCMSKPTGNLTCNTNNAVWPTLPSMTYKKVYNIFNIRLKFFFLGGEG